MPKREFYVDFHTHTSLRSFNSQPEETNSPLWPKTINPHPKTSLGRWINIQTKAIAKQSQANLNAYHKGKGRVIIDGLYPVEKGWLNLRGFPSMMVSDYAQRDLRQVITGYTAAKLQKIRKSHGYFKELEECYNYLVTHQSFSGHSSNEIVKSYDHLIQNLQDHPERINIILSIEGGHAFGSGTPYTQSMSFEKVSQRVIRNIRKVKQWEHPVLFVTLAHHFWNELCGHARSMKPPINIAINQNPGINSGMTKLGWIAVEELLRKDNGRRMLIDIKHMSVQSRIEYYDFVSRHNRINPEDNIPIICSHGGVNGHKSMFDSINKNDNGKKLNGSQFNNWSINLSDEEISIIHESEGIVGMMMDKGLHASPNKVKEIEAMSDPELQREAFTKIILDTMFHIVEVIGNKTAWNMIVIGSDYDGLISHIDTYPDASHLPDVSRDLLKFLEKYEYKKELWFGMKPKTIIKKVMRTNGMNFLKKHFA